MSLIVQKFGGTSVADGERIRACARTAAGARRAGHGVVVVVSAMGKATNQLIALAGQVSGRPPKRELDQLMATGEQVTIALMAMALEEMGHPAVSLTGGQCGVLTEGRHGRARILTVTRERMDRELAAGRIPVVAGFQGVTEEGEITTLGRGGSDTTAVALAAALHADVCEIYTDVDGVFTADPNVVPSARLKDRISYDEMMEAAALGAKVMHLRAVELGKHYSVPIRVLNSRGGGGYGDGGGEWGGGGSGRAGLGRRGTLIVPESECMESRAVSSVVLKRDIGRLTVSQLPNRPGLQSELFGPIAAAGISVDDIIQVESESAGQHPGGGTVEITLTVERGDLDEVREILTTIASALRAGAPQVDLGLCKVSAVGVGMRSHAGVASRMFESLARAGIRIANITTSEIRISCLLAEADGERALRAVHDAFELGAVGGAVGGADAGAAGLSGGARG